jgi:hypothetical protein
MAMLVGLLIVLVAGGVVGARRWYATRKPGAVMGDTTRAPEGPRVLVEVLNASGSAGLAKRATFLLRDRGFDVVSYANDPKGRRSQSVVTDYTGKPEAADRLARVLGGAQIERGKDSLERGLDLTVRLGSNYKPRGELFHP